MDRYLFIQHKNRKIKTKALRYNINSILLNFMNRIVFVFIGLFCLCLNGVFAQGKMVYKNLPESDDPRISFGFGVGLNTQDYKFGFKRTGYTADMPDGAFYYNVQLVTNIKLNKFLSLRLQPGVMIPSENNVAFFHNNSSVDFLAEETSDISRFCLNMPALLKVSAKRHRNTRAFLIGGISPRFYKDGEAHSVVTMKSTELYADAGAGLDIYLPYTKMIIECRGTFGLNNSFKGYNTETQLRPQTAIKTMHGSGVMFTVYFEGGFLNFL